ncbi:hypothetical protein ACFE04_004432 [Oxalis oulophora]
MEPKMSMIPSGVPSADVSQQTNKIVPKLENPSPSPINQTTTTLPPISVAPITAAYPVAAMPLFPVLAIAPTPVAVTDPMVGAGGGTGMGTEGLGKKVRGRPRKYGPDGKLNVALAPTPISSVPLPGSGDSSAWKRCGGKPLGTNVKMSPPKFEDEPETGKNALLFYGWCTEGGNCGSNVNVMGLVVLLGTFLPNDLEEEQILKKPRMEPSVVDSKGSNGGTKPTMTAFANPGDDSASPDTANGC